MTLSTASSSERQAGAPLLPDFSHAAGRTGLGRALSAGLFLVFAVLPMLAAIWYVSASALPQYSTETRFVIRGRTGVEATSLSRDLGAMLGGGAAVFDGYAVQDYLLSADALEALEERVGFRERMQRGAADPLYSLSMGAPLDETLAFYRSVVDVRYSITKQIVEIEVFAFTPEDSFAIATEMLSISEDFANDLNQKARQDLLASARVELEEAEARLGRARIALNDWRRRNDLIDPEQFAKMVGDVIAKLELAKAEAKAGLVECAQLSGRGSARCEQLALQVDTLQEEIRDQNARLTGGGEQAASDQLIEYEQLALNKEFAIKTYEHASASLKAALADVNRQQKYISIVATPRLDTQADWPRPYEFLFLSALAALSLWGLARLVIAAVLDTRYG
ncbi:MAG: hypothetical protein MRY63_13655 [Neomegalonema sp.]|nr:hypothetical protein [Neomegalonema sp.]